MPAPVTSPDRPRRAGWRLLIPLLLVFVVGLALVRAFQPALWRAIWPWAASLGVTYERLAFADLDGWADDDQGAALAAFRKTCAHLMALPADQALAPRRIGGRVGDWAAVCAAAEALGGDSDAARRFFEDNFVPLRIAQDGRAEGLFTGYYEPVYEGRLSYEPGFDVPLYARPPELVMVDLGLFRDDLKGRRIAGRVENGRLYPLESRAEIEQGALAGRGLEIAWLRDPLDAHFLQIQGSGRLRLADGSLVKVGYDGVNGHPNTMIGRLLLERTGMPPEQMSMQTIRAWVAEHPEEGLGLMWQNRAFVFFRILDGDGPLGSLGTVLTPGRSLAVDRTVNPLGVPYWLETCRPDPEAADLSGQVRIARRQASFLSFLGLADDQCPESTRKMRRLMMGEDTGGAIRGAVRGDVFWGLGEEAGLIAGHMKGAGRLHILLPAALAERLLEAEALKAEHQNMLWD